MKTFKLLTFSLFITAAMLFSSCNKEGCTNPDADNYDSEANVSDKSCLYTVEAVFWFEENVSIGLQTADIKKLTYLLNGNPFGTSKTDRFWEEAPNCDTPGTIKFSKQLEKSKSEPFYCTIVDKEGELLWEDLITLDTDSCRIIKLEGL